MSILLVFYVIFSNRYLNNKASNDLSSTYPFSYFNVPNIQSYFVPIKQLRERTHSKSEETPPPQRTEAGDNTTYSSTQT